MRYQVAFVFSVLGCLCFLTALRFPFVLGIEQFNIGIWANKSGKVGNFSWPAGASTLVLTTEVVPRFPFILSEEHLTNFNKSPPFSIERTVGFMGRTSGFCDPSNVSCGSNKPVVRVNLDGWAAAEFNLGTYSCPLSTCLLRKEANSEYDVLLTSMPPRRPLRNLKKMNKRRHVELSLESSRNHPDILNPVSYSENGIDLVVSFRPPVFSSAVQWLPTSYVNAEPDEFLNVAQSHNSSLWMRFEERLKGMLVMISNCDDKNVHRVKISRQIAKIFSPVYSLGRCFSKMHTDFPAILQKCMTLPRRSAMWDAPKECMLHHVMFSFSLENSFEDNYVTEKLWQPLKMGSIPIYSTNSVPSNRKFLPHPDAALFVEDFASLEILASYMLSISKNKTLWFKHAMAWRTLPVANLSRDFLMALNLSLVTLPCRVCDWWLIDTQQKLVVPKKKAAQGDTKQFPPKDSFLKKCARDILHRVRFPILMPIIDKKFGIDAIFVVHYKLLKHRKIAMEHQIRSVFGSSASAIWIEDLDKNELSDEDIACVSDRRVQNQYIKRATHKGEDSLTLKHMAIFSFLDSKNMSNALILEDDARFFQSDWLTNSSQWQSVLKELPFDYDLVMLSAYGNFARRGKKISENLFLSQQSRVSSMYLISRKGSLNMLRTLPIVGPFDFQINYATGHGIPRGIPPAHVFDVKVFWAEPAMSDQHDATGLAGTVKIKK